MLKRAIWTCNDLAFILFCFFNLCIHRNKYGTDKSRTGKGWSFSKSFKRVCACGDWHMVWVGMTFRQNAPQRPLHISPKMFDERDAQPWVFIIPKLHGNQPAFSRAIHISQLKPTVYVMNSGSLQTHIHKTPKTIMSRSGKRGNVILLLLSSPQYSEK